MTIDEIRDNFALLEDWDDRYRYVIELGRTLYPMPEAEHSQANKVQGCASQVCLSKQLDRGNADQPRLNYLGDQAEIDLPYDRKVTFQDLETGEKVEADPSELREAYREQVEGYLASIRRACNDTDVEYHAMFVQEPYDKALVRLLSRRS